MYADGNFRGEAANEKKVDTAEEEISEPNGRYDLAFMTSSFAHRIFRGELLGDEQLMMTTGLKTQDEGMATSDKPAPKSIDALR